MGVDAELVAGAWVVGEMHKHVGGGLCACGQPGPCPDWRMARGVLLRAGLLDATASAWPAVPVVVKVAAPLVEETPGEWWRGA